ncbi:MAG: DUF4810 domain-containing protein [Zoogloeaceae bacterium]|jgi:hypothetical protein|nr:DUF4810 domain-containing protein [Zoogloeaceae bacterium]
MPLFRAAALTLALAFFFTGCATNTERKPLYQWESYQSQVLSQLTGGAADAQIEALERDLEKIKARDNTPPPGFYAHLGMLYAETGNDARAIECFMLEKQRFPEATVFMDRLLKNYQKK